MASMIRNERLTKGRYVTGAVDPEFSDAICGGHRACLIGSLWIGSGIKPRKTTARSVLPSLPGVLPNQRDTFLRHRPGLRLAYDALNTAAMRRIKRARLTVEVLERGDNGDSIAPSGRALNRAEGAAEALFENGHHFGLQPDPARLVASARKIVEQS